MAFIAVHDFNQLQKGPGRIVAALHLTLMSTLYINRAGRQLTPARRAVLDKAKDELHTMFEPGSTAAMARRPSHHSRRPRPRAA